jgi:exosortase
LLALAAENAEMNRLPRGLSFAILCAVSLVAWVRPLLATFVLAAGDGQYTHILLIIPLAVTLVVQQWRESAYKPQFWAGGAALLPLSILISTIGWRSGGSSDIRLTIEMAGLVIWWIGSFLLCFGTAALESFRFPLFFLFAAVPIPAVLLDRIVAGLQQGSVVASQWLFLLFRIPVVRDGTMLAIPGLDIDVTPECSSIRSSLMLLVTTMVLAHLLLNKTWRKVLVVAIAIPLSVAKNGLRIFTIGMLGSRVDPAYLTGNLHHHGGIVFFLIALAAIFLLLWFLRRGEEPGASPLVPQRS